MARLPSGDPQQTTAVCATGRARVPRSFAVGGAQVRFAALANHFGAAFRHIVVSLDGDLALP